MVHYQAEESDRIFVDIPIGLPDDSDERKCDLGAREILRKPRSSSVFRVPVRAALQADNDEEAKQVSLEITGKSISKQSLGIFPKIKEVDSLLQSNSGVRNRIREIHPEICFWALSGENPMAHSKKTDKGLRERIAILESALPSVEVGEEADQMMSRFKHQGVERDDILDAFAAAITASAELASLKTIPKRPETDSTGLPMEMVYVPLN